jgi:hypothetical protein
LKEIFVTASIDLIQIAIVIYLAIGVLLATVGSAGKAISNEVKKSSNPLSCAINDQQPASASKILLLRILLTLVMILLWPILIWGVVEERRLQIKIERDCIEKSADLWFQYMGGCGSIHCLDCHHGEKVTSFIHKFNSSRSGFQCRICGKFTSLIGGGRTKANQYKERLTCDCGGTFDREKPIFCPQCKSRNLRYEMEFIT